MIKLFRSAYYMYILLVIIGCGMLSFASILGYPIYITFVYFLIWVYAGSYFLQKYAMVKFKKYQNYLLEECDPQKYIDYISKLLKRANKSDIRNYVLIILSIGFSCMGDLKGEKQILDKVKFLNSKYAIHNKIIYYGILSEYYKNQKDLENAKVYLKKMNNEMHNIKHGKQHRDYYYIFYIESMFLSQMAEGNYEGCELIFNILYDRNETKCGTVLYQLTLGKIYLNQNRIDEAKKAFQYVIENGNKLYAVTEAKEYLSEINKA